MNPLANVRLFKHRDGTSTIRLGEHQVITRLPEGQDPTESFNAAVLATAKAQPTRYEDTDSSVAELVPFLRDAGLVLNESRGVIALANGTFLFETDDHVVYRTVDPRPFLRNAVTPQRSIRTADEAMLNAPLPEVVQHMIKEAHESIVTTWGRIAFTARGNIRLVFNKAQPVSILRTLFPEGHLTRISWVAEQVKKESDAWRVRVQGHLFDIPVWDECRKNVRGVKA